MKMFSAYNIDIEYDVYNWLRFYFTHGRNLHHMPQGTPAANELKLTTALLWSIKIIKLR